jgi:Flp pilus assembly pilin Flp
MKLKRVQLDQSGQGLTEYITLLLLVSIFSIAAAKTLGGTIKRKIEMAERHIDKISLEEK